MSPALYLACIMEISITHIDTACILLQIGEYKILTDPVLDQPGQKYHHGFGAISSKTERPAMDPQALKGIDLLLLSHHQHWDNFDAGGRMLAAEIPLVLSTKAAGKALFQFQDNWAHLPIGYHLHRIR